ncbi:hypothetical protein RYX36_030061, partial [Vicia faba]
SAEAEHVEFDNTRFTGPLHQAHFNNLDERQIWPENIFTLNPQGDYKYFVKDMEKRKWDVLLTPPTELNFDVIPISGHTLGNKTTMILGFLGLIIGLCRQAGVEIHDVETKLIMSIMNGVYVIRYCMPKLL